MKKYRADIDGLRAIAVLPVLLFHAGLPGFSGGFVGVDVFFVISGFLITGIIARGVDEGRFSILRFYERRFRRLLPALFVVMFFTTLLAWPILSPEQLEGHGEQLGAASLFSSNLYYWRTEDYFAPGAEDLLLLHTWSLAVEEQFYFFFPPLLMVLGAASRWRKHALGLVAIGSFVLSVYGVSHHPTFTFYLLPTRAWELMVGGILALGVVPVLSEKLREWAGWMGLLAIGVSTLWFTRATPFPGLAAALPVLGTAGVLWAGSGEQSAVSRLLSNPVLVQIGKMSYSLYLWHWPLLLLASKYIDAGLPQSTVSAVVALTLSFPISYASWRWVENPFRHGSTSQRGVFAVAGSLTVLGAMTGALLIFNGERLTWWSEESSAMLDVHKPPRACFGMDPDGEECRVGNGEPTVAIWGDSHAHALLPMFQEVAKRDSWAARTYLKSMCPALMGVYRSGAGTKCVDAKNATLKAILSSTAQTVILTGRWALSAEGTRPERPGSPVFEFDHVKESQDSHAVFQRGIQRTISKLRAAGKKVVILGGVPEMAWYVPATTGLRQRLGREPLVLSRLDAEKRNKFVSETFKEIATDPGVRYYPLIPVLCANGECLQLIDGHPAYFDTNHISNYGAAWLADHLPRLVDRAE